MENKLVMNLYKVVFSHHSPKDRECGIRALLLAESDEQVYNWIASEPSTSEGCMYNSWKDMEGYTWDEEYGTFVDEDGNEVDGYFDDDGEPENFKERMLRLGGQIEDDNVDFSDTYYGLTLYGWELLKENVTTDYSKLIELGIVFDVRNEFKD